MDISTQFKINFTIDDESFDLIIKEPNFKERKELEILATTEKERLENFAKIGKEKDKISIEINELEQIIEANKEIIKIGDFSDKIKLLIENKNLIKKLKELKTELLKFNDFNFNDFNSGFENVLKTKAEMLITGSDKVRFFEILSQKGVSFKLLWEKIGETNR